MEFDTISAINEDGYLLLCVTGASCDVSRTGWRRAEHFERNSAWNVDEKVLSVAETAWKLRQRFSGEAQFSPGNVAVTLKNAVQLFFLGWIRLFVACEWALAELELSLLSVDD